MFQRSLFQSSRGDRYQGKNSTPGYYCAGNQIANGKGTCCLRVGGPRIDKAVIQFLLEAITPAGVEAVLRAEREIEAEHEAEIGQWRLQVERAVYETQRAERRPFERTKTPVSWSVVWRHIITIR